MRETTLERIGGLAMAVFDCDKERETAKLLRNRMLYKFQCSFKSKHNGAPCFELSSSHDWCHNCLDNQKYHIDYIRKAHQLSNVKAQLNKAIKEYKARNREANKPEVPCDKTPRISWLTKTPPPKRSK
jgi:hypothetical protein